MSTPKRAISVSEGLLQTKANTGILIGLAAIWLGACGGAPASNEAAQLTSKFDESTATSIRDDRGNVQTTLYAGGGVELASLDWQESTHSLRWWTQHGSTGSLSHAPFTLGEQNDMAHALWLEDQQTLPGAKHPAASPEAYRTEELYYNASACSGVCTPWSGCTTDQMPPGCVACATINCDCSGTTSMTCNSQ
jgi:hypothetical protein